MSRTTAHVPTQHGAKYMQQLCKHWAHKLEVELGDEVGIVRFPEAVTTLTPDVSGLTISIEAEAPETVERLKGVVAAHLDRFAFREAPLSYDWSQAA